MNGGGDGCADGGGGGVSGVDVGVVILSLPMPSPPHCVMFLTEPLQLVIFIIVAIESIAGRSLVVPCSLRVNRGHGEASSYLDGQTDCLSACLSEYFFRVRSKGVHVQDCPVSCTCSAFTLTQGILKAPSDYATLQPDHPLYCDSGATAVKVSLLTLPCIQALGASILHCRD